MAKSSIILLFKHLPFRAVQQAAATTSPLQASTATTFDPMAFMKQFADQSMAVQQKNQTIIVESREDKTHENEAKFNNNMLQLLLLGGTVDFASPGSFVDPRIAKYTQAMKNILLQPALVRAISMANILTTVLAKSPPIYLRGSVRSQPASQCITSPKILLLPSSVPISFATTLSP